ncbi:glycosyltransferase [Novosphingobium sp.]|uniref:glycosyltransferase n=1 Tax=Novosphingobium sp. TaxID=1874826 RepID=UPI0035AF1726
MKVLLILVDLYKDVGGGQTVYRKIIEETPDVEFFYFRSQEPADAKRPANARAIPLAPRRELVVNAPPPHPEHLLGGLNEADSYARSVAGRSFDIVELPDFFTCGAFLRAAFAHHGVKVGRTVLSLHGNISTSIDLNWSSPGDRTFELQQLERLQFDSVDAVYGISRRYIAQWQEQVPREVSFLDPAHFVPRSKRESWKAEPDTLPSLYCIGRSERLKGNDLFVELARWTNPNLYRTAEHIGGVDRTEGIASSTRLSNFADVRQALVSYRGTLTHDALLDLFAHKSLVVLPVRFDTLNLVVLEALFAGCPVMVSTKAGVCDYLDEFHPKLPYTKIDLEDFYGALPQLEDLLQNYDQHRQALNRALDRNSPWPSKPLDMRGLYASFLARPERVPTLTYGFKTLGGLPAYGIPDRQPEANPEQAREAIHSAGLSIDPHISALAASSSAVLHHLGDAGRMTERNADALSDKLSYLYGVAPHVLLRGNFWMEIARVHRMRGQEHMAATYELRMLRSMGDDRFGLLPRITETLARRGATSEAEAAEALYADPMQAADRVHGLLKARYERLRTYKERPLAIRDDRRRNAKPRLSVIVSLYNAADKLYNFLTMLCRQTMLRRGEVEVILVDSGSPSDERSVFEAFHRDHPFDALYVRSADRETIQAAWNRGIALARAPYLAFLGVDEAVYPEAFDLLAEHLEQNPSVDWVQGNSIVTDVDDFGLHKNDVMPYNRQGGTDVHPILDTCYLTFVGGIYRRNLHDRFGYFDEQFRGAGDTEFKNRILPHIGVGYVDWRLGLFMNYADGQTTSSPMAELEDNRSWYLFRSEGGLRYLFDDRPVEDAERLLLHCLGYRKSYCGHTSCDVDLGVHTANYILKRKPHSALARFVRGDLQQLQEAYRSLEVIDARVSAEELQTRVYRAWLLCQTIQARHASGLARLGLHGQPTYLLTNDNRYEQHSWLWKSL